MAKDREYDRLRRRAFKLYLDGWRYEEITQIKRECNFTDWEAGIIADTLKELETGPFYS